MVAAREIIPNGLTIFDTSTLATRVIYVYSFDGTPGSSGVYNRHINASDFTDDKTGGGNWYSYWNDEGGEYDELNVSAKVTLTIYPQEDSGDETWGPEIAGEGGGGWVIIPKPTGGNDIIAPRAQFSLDPGNGNVLRRNNILLTRQPNASKRCPFDLVIFSWK